MQYTHKLLLNFVLVFLLFFSSCKEKPTETIVQSTQKDTLKTDSVVAEITKPKVIEYNHKYDNIATYIAGIHSTNQNSDNLVEDTIWNAYSKIMNQSWDMANKRHAVLNKWSHKEDLVNESDNKVLFYPFSGPDFLNAHVLFPNCSKYILAGLEPVGKLPEFNSDDFADTARYGYLEGVSLSLKDILHSSFFHTKRMKVHFKAENVNGALPILCIFLKRTGYTIKNIEALTLDTSGTIQIHPYDSLCSPNFKPNGAQITFTDSSNSIEKQVLFFSQDLSNGGLRPNKPFTKYLSSLNGYFTFMKSASYLMHYDYFSNIRNAVLDNCIGLMQDDTGIPYRFFKEDKWNVTLYGGYIKPVDTFKKAVFTQKDLQEKFKTDSTIIKKLPFALGYQRNPKHTSIIVALKK